MDYQYHVIAQHLDAKPGIGIQYDGVFRTSQEQQQYVEQLKSMKVRGICAGSKKDDKPYGTSSFEFSMERFWQLQTQWLGDHEISGRD